MAVASRVEKLVALSDPIWAAESAAIWVSANSLTSVVDRPRSSVTERPEPRRVEGVDLGADSEEKLVALSAPIWVALRAPIWVASTWRRRWWRGRELGGAMPCTWVALSPAMEVALSEERLVVESAPSWVAVKPPI